MTTGQPRAAMVVLAVAVAMQVWSSPSLSAARTSVGFTSTRASPTMVSSSAGTRSLSPPVVAVPSSRALVIRNNLGIDRRRPYLRSEGVGLRHALSSLGHRRQLPVRLLELPPGRYRLTGWHPDRTGFAEIATNASVTTTRPPRQNHSGTATPASASSILVGHIAGALRRTILRIE
jgi:hypothetical protein